jgi:phosphoribosyl 1,2-cyclic phosphodiesterase
VRVHFCGTRGSTPAPGPDFVRYGGHTSCVALAHDGADRPTLVLDAGTGLRRVSDTTGGDPFRGTLLLTHLHWDHVQGLPFFSSGDHEGSEVRLLLPATDEIADVDELLARMMSPPFFPIGPSQLRGDWQFGRLPSGHFDCEGFDVAALEVPHKGGRTVGFRVSDGRSSLAYIPDHCPTVVGPGPEAMGAYHEAAMELASGVDLLVHDAHLRAEEVAAEGSFGHAAAEYAVGLGEMAGAHQVVLFHHRPERTDAEVDRTLCRFSGGRVRVTAAEEGTAVDL